MSKNDTRRCPKHILFVSTIDYGDNNSEVETRIVEGSVVQDDKRIIEIKKRCLENENTNLYVNTVTDNMKFGCKTSHKYKKGSDVGDIECKYIKEDIKREGNERCVRKAKKNDTTNHLYGKSLDSSKILFRKFELPSPI